MKKAKELIKKHGYDIANPIVDQMLDELQKDWNQDKIDFWLDVKNDIKKSVSYLRTTFNTEI